MACRLKGAPLVVAKKKNVDSGKFPAVQCDAMIVSTENMSQVQRYHSLVAPVKI